MGFLNNMRLKSELKVVKDLVVNIASLRPDLEPRIVEGRCDSGDEHSGVLVRWGPTDWKLLIICHPSWYVQDIYDSLAKEMIWGDGVPEMYLVARLQSFGDDVLAPGSLPPGRLASTIALAAPSVTG